MIVKAWVYPCVFKIQKIAELPISSPFVLLKGLASAWWLCGFKFKITDLGSCTAWM